MTIVVDWDVKPQIKQNKQTSFAILFVAKSKDIGFYFSFLVIKIRISLQ